MLVFPEQEYGVEEVAGDGAHLETQGPRLRGLPPSRDLAVARLLRVGSERPLCTLPGGGGDVAQARLAARGCLLEDPCHVDASDQLPIDVIDASGVDRPFHPARAGRALMCVSVLHERDSFIQLPHLIGPT